MDAWRWQTAGRLVSDDIAPKVRGVVTWLNFSDPAFFQDFNRNFALGSTRSLKSEGFLTWGPDPWALNLRLSREEAIGFGDGTSVVSERLPDARGAPEARRRSSASRSSSRSSRRAASSASTAGPGLPAGTYDRFDLFPQVSVPLSIAPWLSLEASVGARVTTYGKSLSPDGTALSDDALHARGPRDGARSSRVPRSRASSTGRPALHEVEARDRAARRRGITLSGRDDFSATPLFDEIDSLTPANALRYSLLQHLLAKGETGGSREIASFEIARYYYFKLPGEGTTSGPCPTAQRYVAHGLHPARERRAGAELRQPRRRGTRTAGRSPPRA